MSRLIPPGPPGGGPPPPGPMTSPASPSSRLGPPPPGRLPQGRFGGLFQCCDMVVCMLFVFVCKSGPTTSVAIPHYYVAIYVASM